MTSSVPVHHGPDSTRPSNGASSVLSSGGRDDLCVLLLDDSRLYRDALAGMIEREAGIGSVVCAADPPSVGGALAHHEPDVALVNLGSACSDRLVTAIRTLAPDLPIVAIGIEDAEHVIVSTAESGVAGYLLRDESFGHLMRLIHGVVAGETFCSPRVSAALMRRLALLAEERQHRVPVLTEREDQILRLLDAGLSNQQIADQLCIELRTVKNHVHNLLGKLGVARRGEAVAAVRSLRSPIADGDRSLQRI
jgi:DNA-binding NarL/FixJ family response regulator